MMLKLRSTLTETYAYLNFLHPGNRADLFIWENCQPRYRDLGWKKRDLGNQASPPSHMNTWKFLQRK